MRDKGLGIAISFGLIVFVFMWAQTNGFASQPVASSDVTVQTAAPTVNDDVARGYLPGYVWVDQTNSVIYTAVSTNLGVALWKQIDTANVNAAYGVLYASDAAMDSQVFATAGTFDVITELNIAGLSSGITVDAVGHDLTVIGGGTYLVAFSSSFSGTNNATIQLKVFIDGVGNDSLHVYRKLGTGGDVGSAAHAIGVVTLTAGQVLDLRGTGGSNADAITIETAALTVSEIP